MHIAYSSLGNRKTFRYNNLEIICIPPLKFPTYFEFLIANLRLSILMLIVSPAQMPLYFIRTPKNLSCVIEHFTLAKSSKLGTKALLCSILVLDAFSDKPILFKHPFKRDKTHAGSTFSETTHAKSSAYICIWMCACLNSLLI
eukprot:NODE_525_length_6489_cov_0.356338.p5 type:complete len:143 gc:universal NODE_525_length_6489_cov_0.356338:4565-4993(+)